jgi:hypothetical protein
MVILSNSLSTIGKMDEFLLRNMSGILVDMVLKLYQKHMRLSMVNNELLHKRIDVVYRMLEERVMSEWARNYWTNVLNSLIRQHRRTMH